MRSSKLTVHFVKIIAASTALLMIFLLNGMNAGEREDRLKPDETHPISGKMVTKLLRRFHYNHKTINDSTSSEILYLYIEGYDGNKMYFLASDIENFEQYRYELDNAVSDGDLTIPYLIYNTWQLRVAQRIDFIRKRLESEFDYASAENLLLDRSELPWAATTDDLNELWRKRLKNDALNLKLAGKEWSSIQETLLQRYKNFETRIKQYQSEDVFSYFINALSETYDPHTSYFSPISSENFGIDMSLSLEGIGAQLTSEGEFTRVVKIIPGGPADKSKMLWANDKIVGVAQGENGNFIDVIGMRLDDVVQKIRGAKGSIVRLDIMAADAPAGSPTKEIILVRDKVVLEERAAKSDTLELIHEGSRFKLGVITIPSFYIDMEAQRDNDPNYKSTTRDVRKLIKELQEAEVEGIIIDLRRNGGGSLQEAIELTGLFIEDGPVVQVKSYVGSKKVESDPDPDIAYTGPLAVIVDRFSASASEIFSSAIQDYGRGVIVGNQTFGKGTVQNLLSLDRFIRASDKKYGQLKVTVAKFYRITGSSTQHRGVIPDIRFPSIYNEMDFGEDKQLHALPWDEISPALFRKRDQVSLYLSRLAVKTKIRVEKDPEFQYIREDIEKYIMEKNANTISLSESERKKLRDESEELKYKRVNARRLAKGLAPLKIGDKIPADDRVSDVILSESQHILADLVSLTNPGAPRIAINGERKVEKENQQ